MSVPTPVRVKFEWQPIGGGGEFGPQQTFRAAVSGGWLVCTERTNSGKGIPSSRQLSVTFVPDPTHAWVVIN